MPSRPTRAIRSSLVAPLASPGHISALAHVDGFVVGLLVWVTVYGAEKAKGGLQHRPAAERRHAIAWRREPQDSGGANDLSAAERRHREMDRDQRASIGNRFPRINFLVSLWFLIRLEFRGHHWGSSGDTRVPGVPGSSGDTGVPGGEFRAGRVPGTPYAASSGQRVPGRVPGTPPSSGDTISGGSSGDTIRNYRFRTFLGPGFCRLKTRPSFFSSRF